MSMKISATTARALGVCVIALAVAAQLFAHDFWLVPDAFRIAPGELLQVRGQTSSAFPSSLSAITVDRVGEALVIGARGRTAVVDFSHAGTSLLLHHRPREAGQFVVAMTIQPRSVRESPESFRRYLTLEGAPEVLERLEREGGFPTDSITRRYAKYAKTIVEVGANGPRAFPIIAGHPLEFVPLTDPASVRPGGRVAFQLLLAGRPLANAKVHAGSVMRPNGAMLDDLADTERHVQLQTDANGIVDVEVDRAGLWNVRALYLLPADEGSAVDWETHWVTLVFAVE